MSFDLMRLTFASKARGNPFAWQVLAFIANSTYSKDGKPRATIEGLMAFTGKKRQRIFEALKELRALGEIEVINGGGGRNRAATYAINRPALEALAERQKQSAQPDSLRPSNQSAMPDSLEDKQSAQPDGLEAETVRISGLNSPDFWPKQSAIPDCPNKEPRSTKEYQATADAKPVPPRKRKAAIPQCPYQDIVAAYHETLPMLPAVRALGDKRKKVIAGFWRWVLSEPHLETGRPRASSEDEALAYTTAFFEQAARNDFINGSTQPGRDYRGWKADIEYVLSEKGRVQVLERTEVRA